MGPRPPSLSVFSSSARTYLTAISCNGFRAVLARPEAADYFPMLHLAGGHIADPSGPAGKARPPHRD